MSGDEFIGVKPELAASFRSSGCYVIGETLSVYVRKRPRWLTRVLLAWLLEWKWRDA